MRSGSNGTRCSPSSSPTQASDADLTCAEYAVLVMCMCTSGPRPTGRVPDPRVRLSEHAPGVSKVCRLPPSPVAGAAWAASTRLLWLVTDREAEAIHQAAYAGDAKILKKMVDCGANPGVHSPSLANEKPQSPVQRGTFQSVQIAQWPP